MLFTSPNSVGIDQLSDNLKKFTCNRHVGDSSTTQFLISQHAINERSLLVTVDGLVKEGDDLDSEYTGDWKLVQDNELNVQYVEFHQAPAQAKFKF